jgi:hypothetical protein
MTQGLRHAEVAFVFSVCSMCFSLL